MSLKPLFLAVVMGAAPAVHGATYYVDNVAGDDSKAGTSAANAWQHIPWDSGATNVADATTIQPGDTIALKPGVTYTAPSAGIALGTNGVTITGDSTTWGSGSTNYALCAINAPTSQYISFLNHLTGTPSRTNVTIKNLYLLPNSNRFELAGTSGMANLTIQDCVFDGLGSSKSVSLVYVTNCTVRGVLIKNGGGAGLAVDTSQNLYVSDCTFTSNGFNSSLKNYDGLILNDALDFIITNCIASTNGWNSETTGGDGSNGFDCSTTTTNKPNRGKFINCLAYRNAYAGFGASGDDPTWGGQNNLVECINCIAWGNFTHNFVVYENVAFNVYNCVSDGDPDTLSSQTSGLHCSTTNLVHVTNCVFAAENGTKFGPKKQIELTGSGWANFSSSYNLFQTPQLGANGWYMWSTNCSYAEWTAYFDGVGSSLDEFTLRKGVDQTDPTYFITNKRDNGVALTGFSHDIIGTHRPQAFGWDIGAWEFVRISSTNLILSGNSKMTGNSKMQ